MGIIIEGLLGTVRDGARAVEQLSDDKLKALAEKLKMDALEAMDKRRELRSQKFRTSEREAGEKAGAAEGLLERQSRKDIAGAGLLSRETRAAARLDLDKVIVAETKRYHDLSIKAKEGTAEATRRKTQVEAWKEVGKISERFGSIDEMNGVLAAAGIPDYFVAGKGKDAKPKLVKGKTKAEETVEKKPDTGLSDLDALLAMGKRGAGGSKLEGEVIPRPKSKGLLGETVEVPEVGGEGILQGQQKEVKREPYLDLGDPESWDVVNIPPNYYIKVPKTPENPKGRVKMSDAELEEWKKTKKGQEIFGKPPYDPKFPYIG